MSGIELALALIPLVVTATEHHQKVYHKLKLMSSPKLRDEELEDFLSDLHDEISLLGLTLRCLVDDLTTLPETQRTQLLNHDKVQWRKEEVSIAIKMRLGGDADLAFTDILDRLLRCLDEVVSEKSLRLIHSDLISTPGLFRKLEAFRENLIEGGNVRDLRFHFQFTNKAERRRKNIKKISKYNKKLERFVHGRPASTTGITKKTNRKMLLNPTNISRRMSNDVHKRIARNWSCSCPAPHEARLGLLRCLVNTENTDSEIDLDLLVSMGDTDKAKEIWLESRIRILLDREEIESGHIVKEGRPVVRFADKEEDVQPKSISRVPRHYIETEPVCELIKEAHKNNNSLELCFDGEKLWQARYHGSRILPKLEAGIPLKDLLGDSNSRLTLKEQRVLAVVLSHAILHYCESEWISDTWTKEHVNFFTTTNGPDLMRPYLATQFQHHAESPQQNSTNIYSHPSPPLLSLGILLLEIYLSKPIESLWDPEDTDNGYEGVNTNWITAEKLLDKMGDDLYEGYRNAIGACLKIDYVGVELTVSLDDAEFRELVYERVVIPLETELENGFRVTAGDLGVL
ncbi:hypothetical protein PVAG01_00314 [Phlyctema vagabunda]|uniref:DUF7580 domain-containing protein n=1 Tax=Phlyctema vagabunda TaxID=108571 RepID=A0ABR4PTV9_9HELO